MYVHEYMLVERSHECRRAQPLFVFAWILRVRARIHAMHGNLEARRVGGGGGRDPSYLFLFFPLCVITMLICIHQGAHAFSEIKIRPI